MVYFFRQFLWNRALKTIKMKQDERDLCGWSADSSWQISWIDQNCTESGSHKSHGGEFSEMWPFIRFIQVVSSSVETLTAENISAVFMNDCRSNISKSLNAGQWQKLTYVLHGNSLSSHDTRNTCRCFIYKQLSSPDHESFEI